MRKAMLFFTVLVFFASCEDFDFLKKRNKDKPCPEVASEAVPQIVKDSFAVKYPQTEVETWYNRNGKGFAAKVTLQAVAKLVYFDNAGTFQKEEILDDEQEGEHQDKEEDNDDDDDDDEDGCECGEEEDDD